MDLEPIKAKLKAKYSKFLDVLDLTPGEKKDLLSDFDEAWSVLVKLSIVGVKDELRRIYPGINLDEYTPLVTASSNQHITAIILHSMHMLDALTEKDKQEKVVDPRLQQASDKVAALVELDNFFTKLLEEHKATLKTAESKWPWVSQEEQPTIERYQANLEYLRGVIADIEGTIAVLAKQDKKEMNDHFEGVFDDNIRSLVIAALGLQDGDDDDDNPRFAELQRLVAKVLYPPNMQQPVSSVKSLRLDLLLPTIFSTSMQLYEDNAPYLTSVVSATTRDMANVRGFTDAQAISIEAWLLAQMDFKMHLGDPALRTAEKDEGLMLHMGKALNEADQEEEFAKLMRVFEPMEDAFKDLYYILVIDANAPITWVDHTLNSLYRALTLSHVDGKLIDLVKDLQIALAAFNNNDNITKKLVTLELAINNLDKYTNQHEDSDLEGVGMVVYNVRMLQQMLSCKQKINDPTICKAEIDRIFLSVLPDRDLPQSPAPRRQMPVTHSNAPLVYSKFSDSPRPNAAADEVPLWKPLGQGDSTQDTGKGTKKGF